MTLLKFSRIAKLGRAFMLSVIALLLMQVSQAAHALLTITVPATATSTDPDGTFPLSWMGAGSYVTISETFNGATQVLIGISGTSGSYTVPNRTPGTYYYKLQNYCPNGQSGPTACDFKNLTVVVGGFASPTISAITNRSINEDSSTGAIAFSIADADTAVTSLSVSATSSNTALISSPVLGGSGGSRTITATPLANASGTSTITISVSDGGRTTTSSFVVTVISVNDVPSITGISNVSVNEGTTNLGTFSFTVNDVETAAGSLSVTRATSNSLLIPIANVTLGGSGNARTVSLQSVALATGNSTITVTVSDGSASSTITFVATVVDLPARLTASPATTSTGAITLSWQYGRETIKIFEVFNGGAEQNIPELSGEQNRVGSAQITRSLNGTYKYNLYECIHTQVTTCTISDSKTVTVSLPAPTVSANLTAGIIYETGSGQANTTILSWFSNNATNCSATNIAIAGASGTATYTAPSALSADQTITFTVSCSGGGGTATSSPSVLVKAVNDTPTISGIGAVTVQEDSATGVISFNVADEETASASLTVTATSSNTSLVPNGNLALGGSGGSRTINAVPVANASGSTTITVTVSDGQLTSSTAFSMTVNAVNDAPTIQSLGDISVNQETNTGLIAFAVNDAETPESLQVTATSSNQVLIANGNITLGGSGTSRTISVQPQPTVRGSVIITVAVSDGSLTSSTAFTLTVNDIPAALTVAANDGAGNYTLSWKYGNQTIRLFESRNGAAAVDVLGEYSPSSNKVFNKTLYGTYVYKLYECTHDQNGAHCDTLTDTKSVIVTLPLPVITASLSPTTINENGTATLTWSASNATSCSALGISGVSAASGSVPYTAPAVMNANQVVTIPVTCSGGGGDATVNATINVNWVNDAPTISVIAPRTILEDNPTGILGFTVGDEETTSTVLTVTASSSNPGLIPNGNIVLGGSGNARTVNVIPAANASGTSTITIAVSDGASTSTTSFVVTVTAVNDAPTIQSLGNISVNQETNTGLIAFAVNDAETPASLQVTATSSNPVLISNGNISLGGSGTSRTLSVQPQPTVFGSVIITVAVSDGSLTSSTAFTLTVNDIPAALTVAANDGAGNYTLSWKYGNQTIRLFESRNGAAAVDVLGEYSPSSNKVFNKTLYGTYVYKLYDCTHDQNGAHCDTLTDTKSVIVTLPLPVITASLSPTTINENGTATLTWSASNATSCSALGISGVSAASGSVPYTAPAVMNANQVVTIPVTCSGGGGDATVNATINVNWVNDSPTISAIAPRTILEDNQTGILGFTVSDEETAAASLTVTASSSNPGLVPNGNIVLSGSGNARTVNVIPAANASGTSIITVAVSDGTSTTTTSFVVNVTAVNDAPTIQSLGDISVNQETNTGLIAFAVNDAETPESLQVTATSSNQVLIANGNITLGGSGTSRTISIQPQPTVRGSVIITVAVSDGSLSTSTAFTLTVNDTPATLTVAANDGAGNYTLSWKYGNQTVKLFENRNGAGEVDVLGGEYSPSGSKIFTKTSDGTYTYKLYECTHGQFTVDCGTLTSTKVVSVVLPIPAVPALTATPTSSPDGNYSVSWAPFVNGVNRYDLYENGGSTPIYSGLNTSYTPAIKSTGSFTYKVVACNGAGCSPDSVTQVVNVAKPAVISGVNVALNKMTGVAAVGWNPTSGATRVEIQQGLGSTWGEVFTVSTGLTKVLPPVTVAGTYNYRARACAEVYGYTNCSGWVTTSATIIVPATPTLTAPASSFTPGYTVMWTSVTGEPNYILNENGIDLPQAALSYAANKSNGSYAYTIRACTAVGCSAPSAISNVDVAAIAQMTEIQVVLNQDTAKPTLFWAPVDGATKYEVKYWHSDMPMGQYSNPSSVAISLGFVNTNNPTFAPINPLTPSYTYWVNACASVGSVTNCSSSRPSNSVKLTAPDPTIITSPPTSATGEFVVSWQLSLFNARYELYENGIRSYGESIFYKAFMGASKKVDGTYKYKVKMCRALCSDSNETTTVVAITQPLSSQSSSSVSSVSSTGGGNNFSAPSGGSDVYSIELKGPNAYSPAPTDVPQGPFFVGSLKGQFRVNEAGAATYSVPISIADGIAGVKPSVSVDYNSQGGNGSLGKGWSLSGSAQITRCRQTLSQDGAALPLAWNGQDRFCLSGQRLMLVSGTYGSGNSIYRTELESAVIVTAYGGTAGNPDYFEVTAKDGSTSRYGNVGIVNSEVNARNETGAVIPQKILSWSLSRFEDSLGNPIIYNYETDANYQVLTQIEYACTSKATGSCAANVEFKYVDRTDLQSGYVAGHLFKNNKLLKKITSSSDGEILRTYELYYETTPESLGSLNRVQAIQECVDALNCYPATYFKWFTPTSPGNFNHGMGGFTRNYNDFTIVNYTLLDINGNGMQDYVWAEIPNDGSKLVDVRYSLDNSINGAADNSLPLHVASSSKAHKFRVIDFNGDGHQDLLVYNPDQKKWVLMLARPKPNGEAGWKLDTPEVGIAIPFTDENIIVGDVDSDGLADVIEAKKDSVSLTVYKVIKNTSAALTSAYYYQFAAGASYSLSGMAANYHLAPIDGTSILADFNGDGRVDIGINTAQTITDVHLNTYDINNYAIYTISSSNTFQLNTTIRQGGGIANTRGSVLQVQTVDINGDGLSDIAYLDDAYKIVDGDHIASKSWFYQINTGVGFNAPVAMLDKDGLSFSDKSVMFADLNRDGYPDATWRQTSSSFKPLYARYWNPVLNNFGALTLLKPYAVNTTTYAFGDTNGDSWPELISYGIAGNNIELRIFAASYEDYKTISSSQTAVQRPDIIEEITDGMGNVTSLTYEPLARSQHYLPIGDLKVAGETFTQCHPEYTTPYGIVPAGCTETTSYNSSDFYRQVNAPFDCSLPPANADWLDNCEGRVDTTAITDASGASIRDNAVLEFTGAVPIVTRVESTAPAAGATPGNINTKAKTAVEYLYKRMRMQAKGRGGLGFGYVASVDMQTGIISETAYRQDWPFIGSPFKTRVKTGEGKLLSQAENTMDVKIFGTATAKRFLPFVATSKETIYGLNADGTTSLLQRVNTDTILDGTASLATTGIAFEDAQYVHGNVRVITVTTAPLGLSVARETTNTYYSDEFSQATARLKSSTIKTIRGGIPEPDAEKTINFTYYSSGVQKGLLQTETLEANTANQLVTETFYDDWGNKTQVSVTGKATASRDETRSTFYAYANGPRYLTSTTNDKQQSAAVLARNKYGTATAVADVNAIAAQSYTDAMGQEYLRTDATGAWSRTDTKWCNQSLSGVNVACPAAAYYYKASRVAGGGTGIEYFDRLSRVIRAGKVGFDGKWVYSDTEYDNLSRVVHQSTPFIEGMTPAGWTKTHYDLVGRVDMLTTPDGTTEGTITTSAHSGYRTVVTNDLGHTRMETRNRLGQLFSVRDQLNGNIFYEYNFNGDLLSAITIPSDGTSPVKVRMCYDKLGRKAGMHDPDKGGFTGNATAACGTISSWQSTGVTEGWWHYAYNAFGELIEQRDPKGQRNQSEYDQLGRLIKRDDFRTGNVLEAHTRWFYDTAMDGTAQLGAKGKLTATIMSADGSETCTGSNHCTLNSYDQYARPANSLVMYPNDSTGYISSVDYDSIGRAYQSHDGLKGAVFGESGVQTQFNAYGYAYRSIDMVPRDGSNGVLSEIKEMNAWGKVTREFRGNGLTSITDYNPYTGLLEHQKTTDALGLTVIQENTYDWDSVGNLESRWNQSARLTSGRKDLKEGFCYDGLNRLIATLPTLTPNCNGVTQDTTYNGLGNITYKKGVGTYLYDGSNGGPHAVTSAGGIAYQYDANGNAISGDNRDFEYTSYDMASKVSKGPLNSAEFKYGPDRARWQRIDKRNGVNTTTTYIGNLERIQVGTGSVVEWKRTVAGVVFTYKTSGTSLQAMDKRYVYSDHLGSVDIITNAAGSIKHSLSFDPWGARRDGEDWTSLDVTELNQSLSMDNAAIFAQPVTTRGFTGHEMVDDMGIIHMNGRIYDAKLGRFLQADPHIDGAANTQGYNRYSYVQNNPLNATDPSGFFSLRQFVGVAVAAVATYLCGGQIECGEAAYLWIGALAGGAQAAATGGDILQGVFLGAFTGIAGGAGWGNFFARGFIGGVSSLIMGGKFGHGFMSAGVGGAVGGSGPSGFAIRAIVGGTISEMTGGKFANGATSAVISYLITTGVQHFGTGGVDGPPDSTATNAACVARGKCHTSDFNAEEKLQIQAEIDALSGPLMNKKYGSRREALLALHNSGLVSLADGYGIEFWAQIDPKTFAITKVSTGYDAGLAYGAYDGLKSGGIVWHTHPTGDGIWRGDIESAIKRNAGWIYASGKGLDGFQNPNFYNGKAIVFDPKVDSLSKVSGMKFGYEKYDNGTWTLTINTAK